MLRGLLATTRAPRAVSCSEDVQIALAEARKGITDATTISRLDVLNVMIDAIAMARTC